MGLCRWLSSWLRCQPRRWQPWSAVCESPRGSRCGGRRVQLGQRQQLLPPELRRRLLSCWCRRRRCMPQVRPQPDLLCRRRSRRGRHHSRPVALASPGLMRIEVGRQQRPGGAPAGARLQHGIDGTMCHRDHFAVCTAHLTQQPMPSDVVQHQSGWHDTEVALISAQDRVFDNTEGACLQHVVSLIRSHFRLVRHQELFDLSGRLGRRLDGRNLLQALRSMHIQGMTSR